MGLKRNRRLRKMYVERKPALYIKDLRDEFKNSLKHFKDDDEAFNTLVGLNASSSSLKCFKLFLNSSRKSLI